MCIVSNFDTSFNICFSFLHSIQDDFMKSFRTQQTMWATDWPVTRRTTQSRTPLPSTLRCHFCPSTPTTPHNQPLQPTAAAAPPHQKTPSLLHHTPRPSLNTPRYRACPLLRREWQRTLFPKSSMSEQCYQLTPLPRAQRKQPDLKPRGGCCLTADYQAVSHCLHHCGWLWKSKDNAAFVFGLGIKSNFETLSLFCPVFYCVIYCLKREDCWTMFHILASQFKC